MMRGTLVPTNRLWRMAREIYGGPVFGESYALTSWIHSGNVDSMMGQASRNSGLILDFLLLKIRPLAIYHGAGYFERWSAATWPAGGIARCPRPEYALYSLLEVAPTMDDKIKHEIMPAATNYYQKRRLVKRLGGQPVTGIVYYAPAGRALTSGEAALLPKKEIRRLCEEFADGSKVWLNFADQPWEAAGNTVSSAA